MKDAMIGILMIVVISIGCGGMVVVLSELIIRSPEEKLCYFNHGTGASYDNGECRVITIYK